MSWSCQAKLDAAIDAPLGRANLRQDTRVIARAGWYQIVTPSAAPGVLNEIAISAVEPDEADRVIDEAIATYRAIGQPVKWCVGPWTRPADFGERLARRGFSSWDVRGMAAETALSVRAPDDVTVEEVREESLEAYVRASLRGWDVPSDQLAAEIACHSTALSASPRVVHLFAARVGHEIVGTTGLVLRGEYGYLVGAQVLSPFRGRGVYRALVRARLSFLARRGITLAVTQAREATSAPILERLGFETVFRSRCYRLETA